MTARDAPAARRPTRVLVVDDQIAMAETLAEGLEDRGYDAVAVASGGEALARLERGADHEAFDAVVTDLRMTPMNGLALLAAIKAQDPGRPVLVMTAYGAIDTAVESIRRGASHYLVKPFKLDELVIFLERALAESALRREAEALRRALDAAPWVGGEVRAIREVTRAYAAWALAQLGGSRAATAERLGIDANTLARWLEDEPAVDVGGT